MRPAAGWPSGPAVWFSNQPRTSPSPAADGELWRKCKAELVDERCRDKARVEARPALTEDVADPLVPQCGERGREIHGLRATREHVSNQSGLCQPPSVGAPGSDHDRPLATPSEKARPEVEVHPACHHSQAR